MEPFQVSHYAYATKGVRFGNLVVDYIIRLLLSLAVGIVIGLFAYLAGNLDGTVAQMESSGRLFDLITGTIILIIYYTFLESLFGVSIGKLVTGTCVVMEDGSKPTFNTIMIRSLCRLIPFNALAGALSEDGLFWHDTLSKTRVVNRAALEREKADYMNEYMAYQEQQNQAGSLANNSEESP